MFLIIPLGHLCIQTCVQGIWSYQMQLLRWRRNAAIPLSSDVSARGMTELEAVPLCPDVPARGMVEVESGPQVV